MQYKYHREHPDKRFVPPRDIVHAHLATSVHPCELWMGDNRINQTNDRPTMTPKDMRYPEVD